ncbi:MAG: hypothetical protein NTV51_06200 [Verrucomicrobia bacterium]|nr:hypothetical protein [Verrucomicrobiota bacterium]
MSRRRRHRTSVSVFDREHRSLIKGVAVAAGCAVFAVLGLVLVMKGFFR